MDLSRSKPPAIFFGLAARDLSARDGPPYLASPGVLISWAWRRSRRSSRKKDSGLSQCGDKSSAL